MNTYKFSCFSDDNSHSVDVRVSNVTTWWDVSEEFLTFLQGCGFQVTREDFADYWRELVDEENIDLSPPLENSVFTSTYDDDFDRQYDNMSNTGYSVFNQDVSFLTKGFAVSSPNYGNTDSSYQLSPITVTFNGGVEK